MSGLTFVVTHWKDKRKLSRPPSFVLARDDWNDWGFHTLYHLRWVDGKGEEQSLDVKIGSRSKGSSLDLSGEFAGLSDDFSQWGRIGSTTRLSWRCPTD
jgi:hypothetical protein